MNQCHNFNPKGKKFKPKGKRFKLRFSNPNLNSNPNSKSN